MQRLGAGLMAVAAVVGGWAWYRNQPDPEWLCEAESPLACIAHVALDDDAVFDAAVFDAADAEYGSAWAPEIDVSSATGRIVAAVRASDPDAVVGNAQALALFDLATGELIRTILEPANGWVQTPRFSPDGSLVAAVHQGWNDAGVSVVEVFDAETGESVAEHPFHEAGWDCSGRLGISPDNTEIQCSGVVWELHTRDTIEILDDENRWAGSGYGGSAWAAGGRSFRSDRVDGTPGLFDHEGDREIALGFPDVDLPIRPSVDSAFTDSGDPPDLALLGARDAGGVWARWRRAEWSFPLGSLAIIDDTEVAATALLGFEPEEVGWTADDSAVWILDWETGRVIVVDPGL